MKWVIEMLVPDNTGLAKSYREAVEVQARDKYSAIAKAKKQLRIEPYEQVEILRVEKEK